MKAKIKSLSAIFLILCMLLSIFASCSSENTEKDSETESKQGNGSTDESNTDDSRETSGEDNSGVTTDTPSYPSLEDDLKGDYAASILYADQLKNGVQSYYPDGVKRDSYFVENLDMKAEFALSSDSEQKLTYLKNKNGGAYLQNTMDVFVRMKDGKTYFASNSDINARANVYRIGYYYYDVRILNQSFYSEANVLSELAFDSALFAHYNNKSISNFQVRNGGTIRYMVSGGDPYFACSSNAISFASEDYDALQFTIKSNNATSAQLFVITDKKTSFNASQSIAFEVKNDGEFHTYNVMLSSLPDYSGTVIGFRLDLGSEKGETIEVKDMKAVKLESGAPYILLDRTWHTYSDKLHQELHFVAPTGQSNIDALGMITEIAASTVDKIVIKDKNSTHSSLDSVDWSSVEYVGFDIKNVGVFGYIMPADNSSGSLKVALEGEKYVITQEASPENGEIGAPRDVGNTSNDFFMGQRIYTDETHDFTAFIKEAEWERAPLKGIQSDNYVEYDALRGAYLFTIGGTSFNAPFFSSQNQHFSTDIKLRNMDEDRTLYIRTATTSGCLENAVLLDGNGLLIPIPLEVSKNFGEGEEPVMNYGDATYGETVFPFVATKNTRYEMTVLNLYQNWGKYPLKQLSSIAYYAPYYHLSIGVTETSCISPWYVRGRTLWTLPDFRSQSAPYWFELEGDEFRNEPQHTHAGLFENVHYTDSDGNYVASENYKNVIDSSGPIYAEVKMDYLSDDGKMKITYNHLELPQTDELRTYYEVKFEILEDISFNNFKKDFVFYSWNIERTHVGYLNANGEHTEERVSFNDNVTEYLLGKENPYFGNFGTSSKNATNLGLLIHSSEIYLDGKLFDGNFVIVEDGENHFALTLDAGKTTLKAGDTLTLNIILTPWGSHLSKDASNLVKMRENTILAPLKVSAENGEVIESLYLPRVRTTDGKSAEFTLSGGASVSAVRIYGFNKLTVPKIYEKVDGEWVEYTVSSIDTPDAVGIRHYYDGYMTYYDGDGTYSYAFAVDMADGTPRTFKIEAVEDFDRWPEVENINNDPINVYVDPAELAAKFTNPIPGVGSATLSDKADYIRFSGDGKGVVEVRIDIFSAFTKTPTGQYLVVKYRIPETNPSDNFEFFTSTINTSAKADDSVWLNHKLSIKDGEWHVLVVDANAYRPESFIADADGKYYANYICFDVFNTPMSESDYVDIAYVGICDDLEKFRALDANSDVEEYVLSTKATTETYSMETGKLISSSGGQGGSVVTPPKEDGVTIEMNGAELIAKDSAYKLSTVPYFGRIDTINAYGPNMTAGIAYSSRGSNSTNGIANFNFNGTTTDDLHLVLAGWSLAYGGVDKYVWSVDGKVWHEVELYNISRISTAGAGMVKYANEGCGKTDFDLYAENASYQGNFNPLEPNGIAADLSLYTGQTVNVIFALVPTSAPDTLCILANIKGVEVKAKAPGGENTGAPDEIANPYGDPIEYYLDPTELSDLFKNGLPTGIGNAVISTDKDYISIYGDGSGAGEAQIYAFKTAGKIATGRYIVIKFRTPLSNKENNSFQLFTSTKNTSATAPDSISLNSTKDLKDGTWHVIIIDAASYLPTSFVSEGGKYYCNYVRFDIFNTQMSASSYVDIAYFGISDSIDDIRSLDANKDIEKITLFSNGKTQFVDVKTGAVTDNANGTNDPVISYVSGASQFIDINNAQGYITSDEHYFSRVDSINGYGPSGSTTTAYDMGSNDKTGIAVLTYNGTTTNDKKLVVAGWALVYGGAEKYVWSVDGGKTWNDVSFVGIKGAGNAYDGLFTYTQGKYGSEVDFSAYKSNVTYQSELGNANGIAADLSDFAGKTVNVTFAAVPSSDTSELCILLHVIGITVNE